jgi:predicted DNA-binding protein YlxM (UPF0122 family)
MTWDQAALVVGVLSPLVGAPLVVITLYLRAIRELQTSTMAEINHRIQTIETAIHDLLKSTADLDREYATKEEWVRESMVTRQRLDKVTEMITRIEVELENGHCVAAEIGRIATALTQVMERMGDRITLSGPAK